MKSEYLWDTNTVIYFLQRQFPLLAEQKIDTILAVNKPDISVITEIELLSWRLAAEDDINTINIFLSGSQIHQLDNDVKLQTIEIRKQTRLKLPDAIIAGTAIVYNKTLITRNTADFKKIPNLKTLDLFEA